MLVAMPCWTQVSSHLMTLEPQNGWQSVQIAFTQNVGTHPNWRTWFQRKLEGLMSLRCMLSGWGRFVLPYRARKRPPVGRTKKSNVISFDIRSPNPDVTLSCSFILACKVKLTCHCGWNLCGSQHDCREPDLPVLTWYPQWQYWNWVKNGHKLFSRIAHPTGEQLHRCPNKEPWCAMWLDVGQTHIGQ